MKTLAAESEAEPDSTVVVTARRDDAAPLATTPLQTLSGQELVRRRMGTLGETLAGLPRLHTLVIDTCEGWRLLRDVGQFHGLTHLELKNCKLAHEYEDLDSLANLTRLESLVLRENSNLVRDVSPLEHLSRLTSLTLVSKSYESPWDTSRLEQTEGLTISTR